MNTSGKIRAAVLISMLLYVSGLYAQEQKSTVYAAEDIISASVLKELKEKGGLVHTLEKGDSKLTLVPDTPLARKAVTFLSSSEGIPSFVSENLHIISKAELLSKSKSGNQDASIEVVSKIMRSVSKMKGMVYYSNSKKRWDTLYSESYLIDSPETKKQIPDNLDGSADGLLLYCYQKEHTFGDCIYQLDYSQTENEVSVQFMNLEPLYYMFIRAAKAKNMGINLVVTDCGDSYAVYMVVHADIARISMLENHLVKSMNSRLDAI